VVNTLWLASHLLLLLLVASLNTLLVSPGSINSYAGLQSTLTLISVSAQGSGGDTKREAQTHRLIFLNQSYELTTSSENKVACKNFVI
jgi:hypothetical protein